MTPEQEERVRRALAAEPTEPIPDEVAARLEDVLTELQAERATNATGSAGAAEATGHKGAGHEGAGHEDAAATRAARRWWPRALVAAAVVAVLAVAGGPLLHGLTSPGGSSASSEAGGASGAAGSKAAPSAQPQASSAARATQVPRTAAGSVVVLAGATPELRSGRLRAGVRQVADRLQSPSNARTDGAAPFRAPSCALPSSGPGQVAVAVRLDGRPATLVLGSESGGGRAAQVFDCRRAAVPVATTRIP